MISTKTETRSELEYFIFKGNKIEEHTLEIADELIDRLKFNTSNQLTEASRKVIKYGVEQFTLNKNPHQIGFCMTHLENCPYQNIGISEMIIHLSYLRAWRYFFRLIGKPPHRVSDLYKLTLVSSKDVLDVIKDFPKVHNHNDFIQLMWRIRATLDMSEMFKLNDCVKYWKHHKARRNPHTVIGCYFS